MKPTLQISLLLIFLGGIAKMHGQQTTARIVDAKTSEPIPYATIQFGTNKGIITNEEGLFSLRLEEIDSEQDSLYISSIGYEKTAIALSDELDSLILIQPKPIELSGVYLFNEELDVDEIIEKVKERLPENYNSEPVKQRLFFRVSDLNRLNRLNIDFKKSTIEELNEPFIDSVVSIIPRNAAYYTESLCDYYKDSESEKLQIVKAAELYDKKNLGSMEALGEQMETIFKNNVKPNSYLKIKSGWFGTKVELDSILEASEEDPTKSEFVEQEEENHFLSHKKYQLGQIYSSLFYNEDSKLNFLKKSRRYEFELKGYTALDDAGVYVISFQPKGSADFKGTLFVNIEDYAIMRLEYENVNSLRRFKLLGLYYEEVLLRGTTMFNKGDNGKYNLKFVDKVFGRKMGIKRPLKVIEKNKFVKGRRKQNELALELNILNANTEKMELVVFESSDIAATALEQVSENEDIEATYLSQYDPEFWAGYSVMEPNQAIREFTVLSE